MPKEVAEALKKAGTWQGDGHGVSGSGDTPEKGEGEAVFKGQ